MRSIKQLFILLITGAFVVLIFLVIKNIRSSVPDNILPILIVHDPLQVTDQWLFSASSVDYDLLIKIKNPNAEFGSGNVAYSVNLFSEFGTQIGSKTGSFYILPGQTKYQIIPFKSDQPVSTVNFSVTRVVWQTLDATAMRVGEALEPSRWRFLHSTSDLYYSSLTGLVTNTSDFDFSTVDVSVVLMGLDGSPIAVNHTVQNNVKTGSQRDFQVFWFKAFPGSVGDVIVQATTNLFSNYNFVQAVLN